VDNKINDLQASKRLVYNDERGNEKNDGLGYLDQIPTGQVERTLRFNAIKLSQGEHAGSPLQPLNTWRFSHSHAPAWEYLPRRASVVFFLQSQSNPYNKFRISRKATDNMDKSGFLMRLKSDKTCWQRSILGGFVSIHLSICASGVSHVGWAKSFSCFLIKKVHQKDGATAYMAN
jgi:hypothetical protein